MNRQIHTLRVTLWGAPRTGKTTFVAALLYHLKQQMNRQEAEKLNAQSFYHGTTRRIVEGNTFPHQTFDVSPFYDWQHTPNLRIQLLDLPGKLCDGEEKTFKMMHLKKLDTLSVLRHITLSDAVIIFLRIKDRFDSVARSAAFLNGMQAVTKQAFKAQVMFAVNIGDDDTEESENLGSAYAYYTNQFSTPADQYPYLGLPLYQQPVQERVMFSHPVINDIERRKIHINTGEHNAYQLFSQLMMFTPYGGIFPPRPIKTDVSRQKAAKPPAKTRVEGEIQHPHSYQNTMVSPSHFLINEVPVKLSSVVQPPQKQISPYAQPKMVVHSNMDGNWIDRMMADPNTLRIGVWGIKAAGKTAMMGRLITWLERSAWGVKKGRYNDQAALYFRMNIERKINAGQYPQKGDPNTGASLYQFTIHPPAQGSAKVDQPIDPWMQSATGFKLIMLDVPGENLYDFLNPCRVNPAFINQNDTNRYDSVFCIMDFLSACHGIIVLIDPYDEATVDKQQYFELLQDMLWVLQGYFPEEQIHVPQHISLVFTKIDQGHYTNWRDNPAKIARELYGERIDERLNTFIHPDRRLWEAISVKEIPPEKPLPAGYEFDPNRPPYNLTEMFFSLMKRMVENPPDLSGRTPPDDIARD